MGLETRRNLPSRCQDYELFRLCHGLPEQSLGRVGEGRGACLPGCLFDPFLT